MSSLYNNYRQLQGVDLSKSEIKAKYFYPPGGGFDPRPARFCQPLKSYYKKKNTATAMHQIRHHDRD